ncbi:hypothetical protein F7P74_06410 [Helicobacter pullorum NCTC 12824]|uniref:hypothetical protein n=1 Tax=Helicobacter pullorum TaxID=35818 RepID=UPI00124833CE|nr:hypothetical protein [Helicobacter pullorum]KAB0574563.1 hypothetical protein F7P74_06410 [Helicobacter pullorum NCTC 12824]
MAIEAIQGGVWGSYDATQNNKINEIIGVLNTIDIETYKQELDKTTQEAIKEIKELIVTPDDSIKYDQNNVELIVKNIIEEGNKNLQSIMKTIQPIVREEFDNNRITESLYANVYLGALQTAMQFAYSATQAEQSMKFQLSQINEMQQATKDNRLIKSGEFYSNIIGMALSNNTAVSENLYEGYFNTINTLLSGGSNGTSI